jgi:hypothetical protein
MKWLRLALCLVVFVPGFALLGGFASLDSGVPALPMTLGALVGVFCGLVFAGIGEERPDGPEGEPEED